MKLGFGFNPDEFEYFLQKLPKSQIQSLNLYGKIIPSSKSFVLDTIQTMVKMGAEGVVLGCTEFPLMIRDTELSIPVFNTTSIHSKFAADYILNLAT